MNMQKLLLWTCCWRYNEFTQQNDNPDIMGIYHEENKANDTHRRSTVESNIMKHYLMEYRIIGHGQQDQLGPMPLSQFRVKY